MSSLFPDWLTQESIEKQICERKRQRAIDDVPKLVKLITDMVSDAVDKGFPLVLINTSNYSKAAVKRVTRELTEIFVHGVYALGKNSVGLEVYQTVYSRNSSGSSSIAIIIDENTGLAYRGRELSVEDVKYYSTNPSL